MCNHDGGVQVGEGNSLTDEDNDDSDFDIAFLGMTKYPLYHFKGDENHNLASSCRAWIPCPSSIS